ncbi:MAG: hypothetical protein OEY23_03725 [Acidimicrobiia bacterium]|nr:hypothetical protein [Acidimicrobiia bacterium]
MTGDSTVPSVHTSIERLRSLVDGTVLDRWRVIDELLDLRPTARENPRLVLAIDEAMRTVPGRTLVSVDWWVATLDHLQSSALAVPVSH